VQTDEDAVRKFFGAIETSCCPAGSHQSRVGRSVVCVRRQLLTISPRDFLDAIYPRKLNLRRHRAERGWSVQVLRRVHRVRPRSDFDFFFLRGLCESALAAARRLRGLVDLRLSARPAAEEARLPVRATRPVWASALAAAVFEARFAFGLRRVRAAAVAARLLVCGDFLFFCVVGMGQDRSSKRDTQYKIGIVRIGKVETEPLATQNFKQFARPGHQ